MGEISFGKTGLTFEQCGFGALPIQRVSEEVAVGLLRKAYDGGIRYFDTARAYTDSEVKVGKAFAGMRDKVLLATKTMGRTGEKVEKELAQSLENLQTDYIDVYQVHNPDFCPLPGGKDGVYDALLDAKAAGKIRFIGFTNHRLKIAWEAVKSGLYDTLQFPFSYLSGEQEAQLAGACKERGMGFVAMKALSGGLITDAAAAYAWIMRFSGVVPIWGVQREEELDQFLSFMQDPPVLDAKMRAVIDADRKELKGDFCRGCGYCMPCPAGIEINTCARASLLLRRAPTNLVLSEEGQAMMRKIPECTECGQCKKRCPYGLDTPALLKKNYQDFLDVLDGKVAI
ncbi:MAG: aldo/keto reductase [Clostridiales Family XIII bacterium]|nr:aldo/keto reductase [Clostridiales Family XIII bacterium]